MRLRISIPAVTLLATVSSLAQVVPTFAPLEQWRAAVVRGDAVALKTLYSVDPPARISTSSTEVAADSDITFWTDLKAKRIGLKIAQSSSPQPGVQQIVFQAEIKAAPPGRTLYVSERQLWQQQGG